MPFDLKNNPAWLPEGYKICDKETAERYPGYVGGHAGVGVALIGGYYKDRKFFETAKGRETDAFADKTITHCFVIRCVQCPDGHHMDIRYPDEADRKWCPGCRF